MRFPVVLVLLTCCYGGPLRPSLTEIDARIDSIAKEENDHFVTMQTMRSPESAIPVENAHRGMMDSTFDTLTADLERVDACVPVNGAGGDYTNVFHDELQNVRAEWDRHDTRVRLSTDLGEIFDEERRHQTAIGTAIAALRARGDDLQKVRGVTCP
jgi:hypothetical protein